MQGVAGTTSGRQTPPCQPGGRVSRHGGMPNRKSGGITVFLADDNLIVREGVRALLNRQRDVDVVGVAADY